MGAVRSPALADYFSEWLRKKGIQGIKTESGGGYFAKEKNVELQQDVVVVLGRDLDEGLRVSKESQKIVLTRHEPAEPIFRRVLRTIRRNFEIER